jgi:uncharacterized protein (DUF2225 family)
MRQKASEGRIRLVGRFGNVEPEIIFEAELCPNCGVCVTVKQIGSGDEESFMIPLCTRGGP